MKRLRKILLIEDNPGDVRLVQEALNELQAPHDLQVARDGVQAMEALCQVKQNGHAGKPDLILLDLNLPKKNGMDVLSEIKSDKELKRVPVVVLTASQNDDDLQEAYNRHANCCIIKPLGLEEFFGIIGALEQFWFATASLPES